MVLLRRGDIVLTRSNRWLARQVRKFAGQPCSHGGVIAKGGPLETAEIIESTGAGPRQRLLLENHRNDVVWIYRPLTISDGMLSFIVQTLEYKVQHGEGYAFGEFFTQAIDNLLGRVNLVRRLNPLIPGRQCGSLIAWAFSRAGYTFGVKDYAATPQDIMRYINQHPSQYEQVFGEHLGKYVESEAA